MEHDIEKKKGKGEELVDLQVTREQATILEAIKDAKSVTESPHIKVRTLMQIRVAFPFPSLPESEKRVFWRGMLKDPDYFGKGAAKWRTLPIDVVVELPEELVESRLLPLGYVKLVKDKVPCTPYEDYERMHAEQREETQLVSRRNFLRDNTDQPAYKMELPMLEEKLKKFRRKDGTFATDVKNNIRQFKERNEAMQKATYKEDEKVIENLKARYK